MTRALVEIHGLVKSFGAHKVLDGIDLEIRAGEIVGYIGPNGSGKSTTVKILIGLLARDAGEVGLCGFDPGREPLEAKARLGYVPETALLYESLTVAEHLLFVGRLHGLADEVIRERADACLETFELSGRLGARIGTLSKGMRQKLLLTSALLHQPSVVILDEPLSGLDVGSALLVKELVRELAARGRAILFCSHVMDVVERLCDRIAILHGGRIAAEGSFEELRGRLAGGSLEGIFAGLTGESNGREQALRLVERLRFE
ncbi:MAG: ABC transporter ATP-binding protein [Planctomycetota bacterium]|nr:MAG: ABC transporter ATP-binding protein [Planctomycetota bacterium]